MVHARRIALLLLAGLLSAALVGSAVAQDQDKQKEKKKEEQKSDAVPFPDIDKLLPPGLDPKQAEQFRKQMEMMREMYRKHFEEMQRRFPGGAPGTGGFPAFPGGGFPPGFPGDFFGQASNRLGASLQPPSPVLVDQLDLPKDQGMVLSEVKKDSAADKAGLKPRDILLELGGKPVPSKTREFMKVLNDIKTNEPVDAVVLRKGKKEMIKGVKLPDAPALGPGFPGRVPGLPPEFLPVQPPGFPAPPALPRPPAAEAGGQQVVANDHRPQRRWLVSRAL